MNADSEQATPGSAILLVEDEPAAREATTMYLQLKGFTVTTAASATEALGFADKPRPDLLICDWQLGEAQDGTAVARAFASVPVIFVTAHPTDELRSVTTDLDVRAVLRKPVSLAHLVKVARENL